MWYYLLQSCCPCFGSWQGFRLWIMFAQSLFFLVAEHYAVSDVSCISFSSASPNTRGPWLMNYELKCIQLLWHTARSLRPAVWEALFETAARTLSTKPIGKVRTLHGSFLFIAVIVSSVMCYAPASDARISWTKEGTSWALRLKPRDGRNTPQQRLTLGIGKHLQILALSMELSGSQIGGT